VGFDLGVDTGWSEFASNEFKPMLGISDSLSDGYVVVLAPSRICTGARKLFWCTEHSKALLHNIVNV
jgi:hypothetical protein